MSEIVDITKAKSCRCRRDWSALIALLIIATGFRMALQDQPIAVWITLGVIAVAFVARCAQLRQGTPNDRAPNAWYPPIRCLFWPLFRRIRRNISNQALARLILMIIWYLLHVVAVILVAWLTQKTTYLNLVLMGFTIIATPVVILVAKCRNFNIFPI